MPNFFNETTITLIIKPEKDTGKDNYRAMFLNDRTNYSKTLANQIE